MFKLAIEVCFEIHFGSIQAIILSLWSTKSVYFYWDNRYLINDGIQRMFAEAAKLYSLVDLRIHHRICDPKKIDSKEMLNPSKKLLTKKYLLHLLLNFIVERSKSLRFALKI